MAKYRVAPGIRAVKRQRTTQELERERELRDLQETTVKRRRAETVAQKLRKAEVFPSMEKQQAPVTEPSKYAMHQERGVEAPVLTEPISTTMTEPPHQQGAEASVPAEIITEAVLRHASLVNPIPQTLHSKPVKKSVADPIPRAPTLLGSAEAAFYLDHEVRRCTERTMEGYRHDVAFFARWLEAYEVVEPQQITAQQIRLFLQEIDSRNVSAYTLHRYARVIRAFCNFLVKEEIISRSPMAKVGMPRLPKQLLPAFTVDEVQRLLDAAKHSLHPIRDTAVVLALLDTGCRSAELLALNVGDLDLKTGQVTVRQGKGRKDRLTFLGTKARQAVVQYLRERGISTSHEPLWLTDENGRLTKAGLRQLLGRLAQRAGLSDVHPHKFRRTFALWSLRVSVAVRYCTSESHPIRTTHRRPECTGQDRPDCTTAERAVIVGQSVPASRCFSCGSSILPDEIRARQEGPCQAGEKPPWIFVNYCCTCGLSPATGQCSAPPVCTGRR